MRSSASLLAMLLLAACASTPDESLVWSDQLARARLRNGRLDTDSPDIKPPKGG